MSRCLSDLAIAHVVLERGRVAERWRSERWDSLRLLTPNWQSRRPEFRYQGSDPDGFMTMPEVVDYLESYGRSFAAPIETGTTVTALERDAFGYRVETDRGVWTAGSVVIATGDCAVPFVPDLGSRLPMRAATENLSRRSSAYSVVLTGRAASAEARAKSRREPEPG